MTAWRVLVIDDAEQIAHQNKEIVETIVLAEDDTLEITVETDFMRGLHLLKHQSFDVLVLDVREDELVSGDIQADEETGSEETEADVGLRLYREVRAARFLPIVFFTAAPQLVRGQGFPDSPFVAVVDKTSDSFDSDLRDAVQAVFDSSLPSIHRALLSHVDDVVRDFMSAFVERQWDEVSNSERKGDVAHLLLRRLALSLDGGGEVLQARLANTPEVSLTHDTVHPMRLYIVPPVGTCTTGDLLRRVSAPLTEGAAATMTSADPPAQAPPAESEWCVVLSPACDLVPRPEPKAEFVLMARCIALKDMPEYTAWSNEPSNSKKRRLEALLRNSSAPSDRYYFLPSAWGHPDLVVDCQQVLTIPVGEIDDFHRIATLDNPYSEALVQRYCRYIGRIGTPDLDVDLTIGRLAPASAATSGASAPASLESPDVPL